MNFGTYSRLIMAFAIDSMISREKLTEMFGVLSSCLELPVHLLDEKGTPLLDAGSSTSYCKVLKQKVFRSGECEQEHLKGGIRAAELGESYIFTCHANMNHIAYPLLYRDALLGIIIVGPFLMDEPDSTLITDLAGQHNLPADICLSLYDELKGMRIIAPSRVSQISKLISFILEPLMPSERLLLLEKQKKIYQQSRINESIQMYKGEAAPDKKQYIYQKEQELLHKVKLADLPAAKAILNELLGYVLFTDGGKLESVKSHAVELTTLLSRIAIDNGADIGSIYEMTQNYLLRLNELDNYESICFQLQEIVESFVASISERKAVGGNAAVKEAVGYISTHYTEPLTLQQIAEVVGLSASYLSALFIQKLGLGFREYVNHIRIEEAKRLLTSTQYPLSQIGMDVGFSDQSYFSKVFKKTVGISPNQYR